jgi:hypothetical protein
MSSMSSIWKVLEVAPERVQVVQRSVDRDNLLDAYARVRARGPRLLLSLHSLHPASPPSGEYVERRHTGNGSGSDTEPVLLDIVTGHRTTEPGQVECVAAHARPEPARLIGPRENRDTSGDLACAECAQRIAIGICVRSADEARHAGWSRHLGGPERDAEPSKRTRQALSRAEFELVVGHDPPFHARDPESGPEVQRDDQPSSGARLLRTEPRDRRRAHLQPLSREPRPPSSSQRPC